MFIWRGCVLEEAAHFLQAIDQGREQWRPDKDDAFKAGQLVRIRCDWWWQYLELGVREFSVIKERWERGRGRKAHEGTLSAYHGLLNRCRSQNLYRGFESPPLRQFLFSITYG